MFDFVVDRFHRLPTWGKWTVAFTAFASATALGQAWGERRFVAGFAEALVAVVLYWGTMFVPLVAGIAGGMKVAERTRRDWLGWIVGVVIVLAGIMTGNLARDIPGVGWRIEKMEEEADSKGYGHDPW